MKLELALITAIFAYYMIFEKDSYEASWRVHLFAILAPIFILKYVKHLNIKAKLFMITILVWHIIDILNNAIGGSKKSNDLVHRHADSESDAPSVDTGMGSVANEVSQECEKTS